MPKILDHLLVVDDDKRLRNLLERYLSDQGYLVTTAESAQQAREILGKEAINLVVLDVMMPRESGLEFLESIRHKNNPYQNLPVLLLTALDAPQDRIQGLEAGADDYLTKPFEPKELLLRLENILCRSSRYNLSEGRSEERGGVVSKKSPQWIRVGPYDFDAKSGTLKRGDEFFYLTTTEQRLLEIFVSHPGEELSRESLAEKLGMSLSPRTIDVQITRLRRKLEKDPKKPLYLRTVRQKGYLFWAGDL